jgi:hypothetical protein
MRGAGEWTGGRANFGAALILAGIIVSELRWGGRREATEAGEIRGGAGG